MKYLQFIEQFHDNNPIEIEFVKTQLKGDESQDEVEHMLDFMFSNKHKKLEGLSYKLILAKTKKWDIQLQKVSSKDNEVSGTDYEVYMDFDDGFKIVKLVSKKCYEREGKLMSHCVGSYYGRDTTIFSLRDSKNNPHCTIEDGNQIKGKGNGSIDPKYIEYIVKFLEKTGMIVGANEMKNLGYFKLDKIDKNLTCDSLYNGYVYQENIDRVKDSEGRMYRGMGLWEVQDIVDIQDDGKFRLFEDIKSVVDYTKLVAGEEIKGHYTQNASSGHSTQNASSGDSSQNASSGHYTRNASSGHSTQNASSGHSTRNASSGHSTRNASSGDSTQNASSGDSTQNASSGDSTQNASSGHSTQNASSGDSSQNASSGHYTRNASSGHSTQNASSGHSTQNASSGHSTRNASSGHSTRNASSGHYTQNASSGHYTQNASSGHYTQNASSGHYTSSEVNGKYGITADIGYQSKSKGIIGTWIVLAEYERNTEGYLYPKYVKSGQIDGEILKENTWYILKGGEFTITN